MRRESSYGIIPIKKIQQNWKILLIQHGGGHWSFPKGHPEKGETPKETASRELFEETGITVDQFLPFEPLTEQYWFTWEGELIKKKVTYYMALVEGTIKLQQKEVIDHAWCNQEEAEKLVTYPQARKICQKAFELL